MNKLFRTIHQSFYSKELYQDAALKWKGSGISLLAGLALISTCMIIITLSTLTIAPYKKYKNDVIAQVPAVTVQKGVLSIDRPVPYYITIDGEKFAKIDTSDAANNLPLDQILQIMKDDKTHIFFGKTKVITLKDDGETEVKEYGAAAEPFKFNHTDVERWANSAEIFAIPFIAIFIFLGLWVYKIIQMLIYSVFAIIFKKFIKTKIDYDALQRITACAIFPATILGAVLSIAGSDLPFILSFICTLVFIFFGIKSVKVVQQVN